MIQDFHPTLSEKEQLTHDIWRFRFALAPGEELTFIAGQYMILRIEEVRRLYSIYSTPKENSYFDLLVQMVPNGIGSTLLANLKIGDATFFQGPAGIFFIKDENPNKVFLATGTGIAPIHSMIRTLLESGWKNDVYLFWGLRAKKDVYFEQEISELMKMYPNFHAMICLSQESDESMFENSMFKKGRINMYAHGHMQKDVESKSQTTFYVCGAQNVVESLRQFLLENGIEKSNIHFEKFV